MSHGITRAIAIVACVGVLCLITATLGAQEKKADATIELTQGRVAAGIGWTWGQGTLMHQGKKYTVKVDGLSVGEVGISRASARGEVFGLKQVEDLSGTYTAAEAGATIGGGAGVAAMKNQNGVVIQLVSTTRGASIKLAASGVTLALQK
jgi:hypothetical protein